MTDRSAIVVGGGLAGMVVARELSIRGWRVILIERSRRLGGKAGSDIRNGRLVEHGYHVFPRWYPNVRAILDRIGVRLIDFDRYHFLLPGGYPRRVTVLGPSGLSAMWHYIFNGLLPWYHNILYIYSVLDMISRPLSDKRFLDRVSQIGLIRGKLMLITVFQTETARLSLVWPTKSQNLAWARVKGLRRLRAM
ncbi:MAG TPA: FAD-dependent oxidoreductase [Anaerolineales bacterium]